MYFVSTAAGLLSKLLVLVTLLLSYLLSPTMFTIPASKALDRP